MIVKLFLPTYTNGIQNMLELDVREFVKFINDYKEMVDERTVYYTDFEISMYSLGENLANELQKEISKLDN